MLLVWEFLSVGPVVGGNASGLAWWSQKILKQAFKIFLELTNEKTIMQLFP